MKNLIGKIKSLKLLFRKKSVSYELPGVNPGRDWILILVTSNLLVLISAIASYYLYYKIDSDQLVSIDSINKEVETKINTDLLNKIVSDLDKRSNMLEKIKSSTFPADPSI
jgi:hypothetical protein